MVPPPPGIDASVLTSDGIDPRARLSLTAALAEFDPAPDPPPAAEDDPAVIPSVQRDLALRHYLKGRDEALRGRHLVDQPFDREDVEGVGHRPPVLEADAVGCAAQFDVLIGDAVI